MLSLVRYLIVAMALLFASCDQKETQNNRSGAVSQNASGDAVVTTEEIGEENWSMESVNESYLIVGGLGGYDAEIGLLERPTLTYETNARQVATKGVATFKLNEKHLALVERYKGKVGIVGMFLKDSDGSTKLALVKVDGAGNTSYVSGDEIDFKTSITSTGLNLADAKNGAHAESLAFSCNPEKCSPVSASDARGWQASENTFCGPKGCSITPPSPPPTGHPPEFDASAAKKQLTWQ